MALVAALVLLGACNGNPEERLLRAAERAVTDDFDSNAIVKFEDVKGVARSHLACGHVTVHDSGGRLKSEKDFVFKEGKVIYDDNPTYPRSVIECYEEMDADKGNKLNGL